MIYWQERRFREAKRILPLILALVAGHGWADGGNSDYRAGSDFAR